MICKKFYLDGGVWARNNNGVGFSTITSGFKSLLPHLKDAKSSCSDDDGLAIDYAVSKLKLVRKPEELDLIFEHYVLGHSKSFIARKLKCNEREVRRRLQVAEGFIDGCLCMIGKRLDME